MRSTRLNTALASKERISGKSFRARTDKLESALRLSRATFSRTKARLELLFSVATRPLLTSASCSEVVHVIEALTLQSLQGVDSVQFYITPGINTGAMNNNEFYSSNKDSVTSLYRPVSPQHSREHSRNRINHVPNFVGGVDGPDALARQVFMTGQLTCKGRLMCVAVPGSESASSVSGVIWCQRVPKPGVSPARGGGGGVRGPDAQDPSRAFNEADKLCMRQIAAIAALSLRIGLKTEESVAKIERIRGVIHDMQAKSENFKHEMVSELARFEDNDEKLKQLVTQVQDYDSELRASSQQLVDANVRVAKLEEYSTSIEGQMREIDSEKRDLRRRLDQAELRAKDMERRMIEDQRTAKDQLTRQSAREKAIQSASDHVRMNEHSMRKLFSAVAEQARQLVGAERASLFIIEENEKRIITCDLTHSGSTSPRSTDAKSLDVVEFADGGDYLSFGINQGLAGAIYRSGADCLNITKSAYSDARFFPPMDQLEGYRTRTAMCIPIYDRISMAGVEQDSLSLTSASEGNSKESKDNSIIINSSSSTSSSNKGKMIGVIEVLNKRDLAENARSFSSEDGGGTHRRSDGSWVVQFDEHDAYALSRFAHFVSASIRAVNRNIKMDQAIGAALQREKDLNSAAKEYRKESGIMNMYNLRADAISQISAGLIKKWGYSDSGKNSMWELFELVSSYVWDRPLVLLLLLLCCDIRKHIN